MRSRPSLVGVDMSILAELGSLAPHSDWEVEVLCVLVIPSDRQGSRGPRKDPGDAERQEAGMTFISQRAREKAS